MESQMYTSVENVKKFLAEHKEKPFIMCEYTHAMGNSCGAMHKYTDLTDTEPRYQGGFIWEWYDHGIEEKDANGNGDPNDEIPLDYNAYGGNDAFFNSAYSLTNLIGSLGIQTTDWGTDAYFAEDGKSFIVFL